MAQDPGEEGVRLYLAIMMAEYTARSAGGLNSGRRML